VASLARSDSSLTAVTLIMTSLLPLFTANTA
jgi:hypothetical protein